MNTLYVSNFLFMVGRTFWVINWSDGTTFIQASWRDKFKLGRILLVKISLSNWPLTFIEGVIHLILTVTSMLLCLETAVLWENSEEQNDRHTLRKRQNYTVRCKDAALRRWNREYLTTFCARQNLVVFDVGDVVLF